VTGHRLISFADRLSGAVGRLCAVLLLGMIATGASAAILRYLAQPLGFSPALNALADAQWMLFSAVVLLGAAWALRDDAHVRVDVLFGRLSPRGQAWINLLGTLLLLLPFCALLMWVLWPAVVDSVALREGAADPGGLPRWPVKTLVPVSIALLALQGVAQGLRAVATLRGITLPDATR
jgi:TRAP-type mannitol/chloroaromatic compound transport system permease small subunit